MFFLFFFFVVFFFILENIYIDLGISSQNLIHLWWSYSELSQQLTILTLKAPSKICSRWHSIFFFYFSEKTVLIFHVNHLPRQKTIHMKCQDLFSLIKKKLSSAADVIGTLRVNLMRYQNAQKGLLRNYTFIQIICINLYTRGPSGPEIAHLD